VVLPLENSWGIDLNLLQSQQIAPHLGGNKHLKLVGYLKEVRARGFTRWITMAGTHSNHLRAFATLSAREHISATAIIRGDELAFNSDQHSDEIKFAARLGVDLHFVSRTTYRQLRDAQSDMWPTLAPTVDFAGALCIPEGGLGPLALAGVANFAVQLPKFHEIWLPAATGATAAGLLSGTAESTKVVGVAVYRNASAILENIKKLVPAAPNRFELIESTKLAIKITEREKFEHIAEMYTELWGHTIDAVYLARVVAALAERASSKPVSGKIAIFHTFND